jgi:hypothetical protein
MQPITRMESRIYIWNVVRDVVEVAAAISSKEPVRRYFIYLCPKRGESGLSQAKQQKAVS